MGSVALTQREQSKHSPEVELGPMWAMTLSSSYMDSNFACLRSWSYTADTGQSFQELSSGQLSSSLLFRYLLGLIHNPLCWFRRRSMLAAFRTFCVVGFCLRVLLPMLWSRSQSSLSSEEPKKQGDSWELKFSRSFLLQELDESRIGRPLPQILCLITLCKRTRRSPSYNFDFSCLGRSTV